MIGERNRHPLRAVVNATERAKDRWEFLLSCGHQVTRYKQNRYSYTERKLPKRCRCKDCHEAAAPALEPSPFDVWT